jgi:hypothetical protein
MIGTVTFRLDGQLHVAVLAEDGTWSSQTAPALMIEGLNADALRYDSSPANGDVRANQLFDTAALLSGSARLEPKTAPQAGTVF